MCEWFCVTKEFAISQQGNVFSQPCTASATLPEGFRYQPGLIPEAEEQALAAALLGALPLKAFEFQGHFGNRRVQSFGLRYDDNLGGVELAEAPPPFLEPLLSKVAEFAGRVVPDFRQIGINEYRPGAGIGWHRDKPQFGDVLGVSLLFPAKNAFSQTSGQILAPRVATPRISLYLHVERGSAPNLGT